MPCSCSIAQAMQRASRSCELIAPSLLSLPCKHMIGSGGSGNPTIIIEQHASICRCVASTYGFSCACTAGGVVVTCALIARTTACYCTRSPLPVQWVLCSPIFLFARGTASPLIKTCAVWCLNFIAQCTIKTLKSFKCPRQCPYSKCRNCVEKRLG